MECLGNREVLCRRLVTFAMLERDTGASRPGFKVVGLTQRLHPPHPWFGAKLG